MENPARRQTGKFDLDVDTTVSPRYMFCVAQWRNAMNCSIKTQSKYNQNTIKKQIKNATTESLWDYVAHYERTYAKQEVTSENFGEQYGALKMKEMVLAEIRKRDKNTMSDDEILTELGV